MRFLLTTSASLALLLAASTITFAQDTGPRSLTPRTLNPNAQQEQTPSTNPVPVKTISGGINVQTLGDVSSEASGLLSGSNAFPSDMWNGVNRNFAERMIAKLPARPSAPYLRILQRRLLLSAATPPAGKAGPKSLVALRAEKLAQMGQINDTSALINTAPQNLRNSDLAMLEARAYLVSDQVAKACTLAAQNIETGENPFWVKTLAFCRMMAKQGDQAMLSLSLLKEMGDNDPVYYALMDALHNEERGKVESLPNPKALEIALIAASKAQLSDQVRKTDDPNFLSYLTKAGDILAVERAVEFNLASADFLGQAYKSVEFKPEELDNPIATAENLNAFKAQALLYQVTAKEGQLAVIRTETISMALDLAVKSGNFFSISRLYRPFIADLSRTVDMLWFAPNALRSLLAAGDWENAKAWYLMLRNASFTDAEAAKNWTSVRPLAALAGFDVSAEAVSQSLKNWWQAQPERPESFAQANTLYALSDGLGLNVPDHLWISLMDGPRLKSGLTPKPGIWIKMNKAAQAGRVGETMLMVLNGLGHDRASQLEANFLRDALAAMRLIGLQRDARAVAVETALQAGL
ncbi:hypothetical protein RYZ26_17360 [Terasakiella sp. A23]|uniref:hypothetical protein n=1 Tax=Terasakiella sp. FCG-A23 TaxID=3080561 RepID=UPI0029554131|nr:hypothetical protein [Terasakiella sp. A23]MDV7341381.1 hypothetical protein [Terasakiella sp. A23]